MIRLWRGFADDSMRVATLVGLLSIPFTVLLSPQTGTEGTLAGLPVFVAGIITGLVYAGRSSETRRAGMQTGLTASVGVVVYQLIYLREAVQSYSLPDISFVVVPVIVVIGVVLSVFVGIAGTVSGSWFVDVVRSNG